MVHWNMRHIPGTRAVLVAKKSCHIQRAWDYTTVTATTTVAHSPEYREQPSISVSPQQKRNGATTLAEGYTPWLVSYICVILYNCEGMQFFFFACTPDCRGKWSQAKRVNAFAKVIAIAIAIVLITGCSNAPLCQRRPSREKVWRDTACLPLRPVVVWSGRAFILRLRSQNKSLAGCTTPRQHPTPPPRAPWLYSSMTKEPTSQRPGAAAAAGGRAHDDVCRSHRPYTDLA